MKLSHCKRALYVFCSLLLLLSSINMPPAHALTDKEKIEQYKAEQKELDKKIAEQNKNITDLKKTIGEQEKYAEELQEQIRTKQKKIDSLNAEIRIYETQIEALNVKIQEKENRINEINESIQELEKDIAACEARMEETRELLKQRLISLYMQGETSMLELLMESDSLSNFLMRIELTQNITRHDTSLIEEIRGMVKQIEADKKQIEDNRAEVEAAKQLIVDQRSEVQAAENEIAAVRNLEQAAQDEITADWDRVQEIIGGLEASKNQASSIIKKYNQDKANFEAKINALSEQLGSSPGSGGSPAVSASGFAAPMKYTSAFYVSSPYGWRSMGWHAGVDITRSSAMGTPIYASKAGKVIVATYDYSYGNYVMLDHGNGVRTVYAHCNSLAVSYGQTVSQGQLVGYLGNTGRSTGPHLHFEIRIPGKGDSYNRVDPAGYIPLPRRGN